jgi:hypothetical protein
MTPDQQFWWNWSVNVAGVVASLFVVAVALFGERFWKWKFPPKLNIKLLEQYGEKTVAVGKQPNGLPVHNDVRFFHLQVWNERRRWSPAHNAQVFLTSIEEEGPDGRYQVTWLGNVPVHWRDQEFTPVTQTIGAQKDADFLMVGKQSRVLSLTPLLAPNNLTVHWEGGFKFIARFQVRSDEADSEDLRAKVSWDGIWEDGDFEMHKHLHVKEA